MVHQAPLLVGCGDSYKVLHGDLYCPWLSGATALPSYFSASICSITENFLSGTSSGLHLHSISREDLSNGLPDVSFQRKI